VAELASKEQLQPALLDRLTDNEPEKRQESRTHRVMSIRKLRQAVMRDLGWLLNTTNLEAVQDLDDYPLVGDSVVNYGLPELAGHAVSGTNIAELERIVRQAIQDFEPRILRNTLKVRAIVAEDQMNRNAVSFDIEAHLWAQPAPEHLFLKTHVDLESGDVQVTDSG